MKGESRESLSFLVAKALDLRTRTNAPLSTILATTEMLLERPDLPADLRRKIESLRQAGQQIKDALRELDRTDPKTRAYLEKRTRHGR
ncbi:MAG TPA: hypothetical protein VFT43_09115 [Candidatus Polarisedimenticolia bacterium]|nr:hypothetical protein [Candidatus Polarisedimenticolia bacterium]